MGLWYHLVRRVSDSEFESESAAELVGLPLLTTPSVVFALALPRSAPAASPSLSNVRRALDVGLFLAKAAAAVVLDRTLPAFWRWLNRPAEQERRAPEDVVALD